MPLELPNLDDRTYADLVEEARRLIPSLDAGWTDHNPSEPGITLVEMFGHLSEMLLYRLNRVTDANQDRFLKLLNGPTWAPAEGRDLEDDKRAAVRAVRARYRAVSAADYEHLAAEDFNDWLAGWQKAEQDLMASRPAGNPPPTPQEWFETPEHLAMFAEWWEVTQFSQDYGHAPSKVPAAPAVARARCVTGRNLEWVTESVKIRLDPGHVSLIVVPYRRGDPSAPDWSDQPFTAPDLLKSALWGFLDERRVLTTRHHVVAVSHAPVRPVIVLARTPDALVESRPNRQGLVDLIQDRLQGLLDPLEGGEGGRGWPFGRGIYVSELVEQLESLAGVDYVTDFWLTSTCEDDEIGCVPAPPMWHAEGDLIGLALEEHHLPKAIFGATPLVDQILILPHATFLPLRVAVTVSSLASTDDPVAAKRLAKTAVRKALHPFENGPKPTITGTVDPIHFTQYALGTLQAAIVQALQAGGISNQAAVAVAVDIAADRRALDAGGNVTSFKVYDGEVLNWQVTVTVPRTTSP